MENNHRGNIEAAERGGGAAGVAEEEADSRSVWEADVAELGDDCGLGAGSREVALGWGTGGWMVGGAGTRSGLAGEDHALCWLWTW